MAFVKQNSITTRIEKMRQLWITANRNRPAIIVWQTKADETEMVDAFYLVEEGEDARLPELFFQLDFLFTDRKSYAVELQNQLMQMYTETMKYYTVEGMSGLEKYKSVHDEWSEEEKAHPTYFLDNLSSFAACASPVKDARMVVYLTTPLLNLPEWLTWWDDALATGIPANLVFMLRDSQEVPVLGKLVQKYPAAFEVIRTDLKMNEAIRQEARSSGDPNEPSVRYRVAILDMAEAAGRRDSSAVRNQVTLAFTAAQSMANVDLQATAFLAGGIHLFNLHERREAMQYYDRAIAALDDSTSPVSAQICSQVHAARGAWFFERKRWSEAVTSYSSMASCASANHTSLLEMEGWRMAGYCALKMNNYEDAFELTKKAYQIGISQEPETMAYSTLPHTGNQLLEVGSVIVPGQIAEFENQLQKLLGHDWQTQFRTPQAQS